MCCAAWAAVWRGEWEWAQVVGPCPSEQAPRRAELAAVVWLARLPASVGAFQLRKRHRRGCGGAGRLRPAFCGRGGGAGLVGAALCGALPLVDGSPAQFLGLTPRRGGSCAPFGSATPRPTTRPGCCRCAAGSAPNLHWEDGAHDELAVQGDYLRAFLRAPWACWWRRVCRAGCGDRGGGCVYGSVGARGVAPRTNHTGGGRAVARMVVALGRPLRGGAAQGVVRVAAHKHASTELQGVGSVLLPADCGTAGECVSCAPSGGVSMLRSRARRCTFAGT